MDAWHKRGSPKRNVILIGANNKNGKIKQDKGRLNAVRTRPGQSRRRSRRPRRREPSRSAATSRRPTRSRSTPRATAVIYSVELVDGLVDGEQLSARAGLTTDVTQLNHNANVSTRDRARRQPDGDRPRRRRPAQVADLKGEITENNGFNCTKKQTPCPSIKDGVIAIKKNANAPLLANLVLNISGLGHAAPNTFLPIPPLGGIEVTRYPASANG